MADDYTPAPVERPGAVPGWMFVAVLGVLVGGLLLWQLLAGQGRRERSQPVISELQAQNNSGLRDDNGNTSDWIELWNPADEAVDLEGWSLTDDFHEPRKWVFPAVTLEAGRYLVVFATGLNRTNPVMPLHTNFELRPEGEYLALLHPGGNRIAHELLPKYPRLEPDTSFGLRPELFQGEQHGLTRDARDLAFLLTPTPGGPNRDELLGLVADTRFSRRRGFHPGPVTVEISSKTYDVTMRYTTDGSAPTLTSGSIYTEPLRLNGDTVLRVAAFRPGYKPSNVDTHTFLFPNEWREPGGLDSLGPWNDRDALEHATNRASVADALQSLPVLSVAARPGRVAGIGQGAMSPSDLGAERVSVELLFPNNEGDLNVPAGLRLPGGAAELADAQARIDFQLLFRTDYGLADFKHHLFDESRARVSRALVVEAGAAGWGTKSLLEAEWMRRTLQETGQFVLGARFVNLLVNGGYRGVHLLRDRPAGQGLAASFPGATEFDVRAETGLLEGEELEWNELQRLSVAEPTAANYEALQNLLEIPSLIDFVLVHVLAGQPAAGDPPVWYAVRPRTRNGRFAFLLGDLAPKPALPDVNVLSTTDGTGPWALFQRLRRHEGFRRVFADRAATLLGDGGALSPERSRRRYREAAQEIDAAMVAELARWSRLHEQQKWRSDVESHGSEFYARRVELVGQQLAQAGLLAP